MGSRGASSVESAGCNGSLRLPEGATRVLWLDVYSSRRHTPTHFFFCLSSARYKYCCCCIARLPKDFVASTEEAGNQCAAVKEECETMQYDNDPPTQIIGRKGILSIDCCYRRWIRQLGSACALARPSARLEAFSSYIDRCFLRTYVRAVTGSVAKCGWVSLAVSGVALCPWGALPRSTRRGCLFAHRRAGWVCSKAGGPFCSGRTVMGMLACYLCRSHDLCHRSLDTVTMELHYLETVG